MLIIIEGLVMCFLLLLICVVGIANGPVGLVVLYEQDVQDRVVELGLTTKVKIGKWLGTLVMYPLLAALMAWIISLF